MTNRDHINGFAIVDRHRSVDLDDVGGPGRILAIAVDSAGAEHLGVIERRTLGDRATGFSMGWPEHENVGALPIDVLQRIAIAQRTTPPDQRTDNNPDA
jgi:hypothetical protein